MRWQCCSGCGRTEAKCVEEEWLHDEGQISSDELLKERLTHINKLSEKVYFAKFYAPPRTTLCTLCASFYLLNLRYAMSNKNITYHPAEEYKLASEALTVVCEMVLFVFANHDCDTKNTIIRNFIARASTSLKGVFLLWDINDHQDAWIIYRSLLDRLFHLKHIANNNEFQQYDDWSFYEQYKAQNRVKSDQLFKQQTVGSNYKLTQNKRERISSLSKNPPSWKRPKAEAVAKSMEMDFLYHYGYDYASTHVHPMANDGEEDFFTITKIKPLEPFPSHISLLSNTILAVTLILQEALNYSSFSWRKILWDFIDQIREMLEFGNNNYAQTLIKICHLFQEQSLGVPNRA